MQVSQSAKLSQPQANKSSSGTPERYRCVADRQMRNRWPPVQACPTYSFARRGMSFNDRMAMLVDAEQSERANFVRMSAFAM